MRDDPHRPPVGEGLLGGDVRFSLLRSPTLGGLYSRGYLFHFDAGRERQFVTWRLADSIPTKLIEQWRAEVSIMDEGAKKRERYRRCESYMDQGHGSRRLRNPAAARIVQEALFVYHGKRFVLHRWVVMPNHIHVLLAPCEGVSLEAIFKPLRSSASSEINKLLGRTGQLWSYDFFDRLMRNENHVDRTAKSIEWDPV